MTAAHPPNCLGSDTDRQHQHIDERGCCACGCPDCSTRDGAGELLDCICRDCIGNPPCGIHDERETQ
jgi:hypothetical protein